MRQSHCIKKQGVSDLRLYQEYFSIAAHYGTYGIIVHMANYKLIMRG